MNLARNIPTKFSGNQILDVFFFTSFLLLIFFNKNPFYLILLYQNYLYRNLTPLIKAIFRKVDLILILGIGIRSLQINNNESFFKFDSLTEITNNSLFVAESLCILTFFFFKYWIKRYLKNSFRITRISDFKIYLILGFVFFAFLAGAGLKNQRGDLILEILDKFIAFDLVLYISLMMYVVYNRKQNLFPILLIACISILTGSRYIFLFLLYWVILFIQKLPATKLWKWALYLFIIPMSLLLLLLTSQVMRFGGDITRLPEILSNTELLNIILERITMRFNLLDGAIMGMNFELSQFPKLAEQLNIKTFILSFTEQLLPLVNFKEINSFGQIIGNTFPVNENLINGYGGALGIIGTTIFLIKLSSFNIVFALFILVIYSFSRFYKSLPTKIFFVDSLIFFLIGGNFDAMMVKLALNLGFFTLILSVLRINSKKKI